ncbi:hypothetical protein [Rhizobium sullae]|uniref:hypothetical protein n=1 Tax=Rhizobium sullae TaxID=50338 RepID=UPI00117A5713|nr:hypothetical protein [Rhizobium sullae]
MALGASHRLQDGIDAVETMTRFAFAVLALASGVYTYLGVRSILDGSATAVFFAALIYSSAVSVAIYAFWTYMARFYPHVTGAAGRGAMLGVMALGCAMIIAMSSWLNAAALAGSAALEQHLAETLEDYTADLDKAHQNALAAQSLLPDIQRTQERFERLADQERETGALTGTTGAGSVVQLLSQMASQLTELENGITASRERVTSLFDEGRKHLETMRKLVSAPGAIDPRADQFAAEVVGLSGVITSLEQTSIAPSVKRAAEDLSLGFIAPVADGREADLATRQDQVMETIRSSVAAQSKVLSQAADQILSRQRVAERRFVPLSSAEAVLRYASDFIPSWAGAISIDILPAVLIFMLSIVHSTLRRQEQRLPFAERITAAELLQALEVQRAVRQSGVDLETALAEAEKSETPDQSNIASFDLSGKGPRKGPPA